MFGPLKQAMTRAARALGYLRQELVLTSQKFPVMLDYGLKSLSEETIRGAFKVTGTYPAVATNVDM